MQDNKKVLINLCITLISIHFHNALRVYNLNKRFFEEEFIKIDDEYTRDELLKLANSFGLEKALNSLERANMKEFIIWLKDKVFEIKKQENLS